MQIELLLVVILKALAELAGMFLLGRGLLWLLAGGRRMDNVFYQVLAVVTDPLLRFTRRLAPRVVLDAHVPLLAFGLVLLVWVATVFWALPQMCASGYDCSALLERKRGG
jgi:uncharacterized protein YggT (Ycf19 family)